MPPPPGDAKTIFLNAVEFDTSAHRRMYVEMACAGDDTLRAEVEELLRHWEGKGSFLESPALELAIPAEEPPAEPPGTMIGPYKLLRQIGEGGMGIVYLAEQEQPVRRKVALKILKPGIFSRQAIARFEAERQALAVMDHLNIAKVYDASTTGEGTRDEGREAREPAAGDEDAKHFSSLAPRPSPLAPLSGRPFFVMELVHGVPITKFCDANRLTLRQRLELFVPVCRAIQHAHQKGVIHRDVKPSNVLVTLYDDKPVPKVIDFGVAKAVEQRLTDKTMFTQLGALVGTWEYMSPEQAEMSNFGVDTRSDVYSLGVLLYELLTGTTPLERRRVRDLALDELVRLIRQEEPPPPSVRLSTVDDLDDVAAARRTEPGRLVKLVRGEIDWIVMKCLEKDRARRYETAIGLAEDVERYLHDEPVEAGPPSTVYRLRKLARKHRAAFLTAVGFMLLLLAGSAVSTWQALRASRAEREARAARDTVSLYQELLLRDPKLRTLPTDHPDRALALIQLGQMLLQFGQPAEAEQLLRECLAIREKLMPGTFRAFNARSLLGLSLLRQNRYAEAEPLLLQSYAGLKQQADLIPRTSIVQLTDVMEWLVELYDAWSKPDQTAYWRKQLDGQRPPQRERRRGHASMMYP